MITTTAAGRTWHFDRSLGRPTNEHNGKVGGYRYPADLAIAPDGILFVLSKGFQLSEQLDRRDNGRIGKTTFDEHHLGDFARQDFTWPGGIALDSEGWVYVTDWGNRRVQAYEPNGDVLAAFYGDAATLSKAGEYIIRRDPGTIKAYRQVKDYTPMGRFQRPTGIEVDACDRVIVADMCGRLQVYAKDRSYAAPEVKLELE